MLPEIAAEALHYLSRRDLDKASAVSKWLDAMVAKCCDEYPLRPVFEVALDNYQNAFSLMIRIEKDDAWSEHPFGCTDEAVHFLGSILRHSYVEELELYKLNGRSLSREHWSALVNSIHRGTIRALVFSGMDFSELDDDALLVAVGCHGLESLEVCHCVIPGRFVPDALVRSSAATGVRELRLLCLNYKSDTPLRFSDAAVLDFIFPADAASWIQLRELRLEGTTTCLSQSSSTVFNRAPADTVVV